MERGFGRIERGAPWQIGGNERAGKCVGVVCVWGVCVGVGGWVWGVDV